MQLQVKNMYTTEIDPSHYALELISKMLKYERVDRISSDEVVIQLKSIKQKVIKLYINVGESFVY
jgi:hypothetical protein